jgi:hypothetical protein
VPRLLQRRRVGRHLHRALDERHLFRNRLRRPVSGRRPLSLADGPQVARSLRLVVMVG